MTIVKYYCRMILHACFHTHKILKIFSQRIQLQSKLLQLFTKMDLLSKQHLVLLERVIEFSKEYRFEYRNLCSIGGKIFGFEEVFIHVLIRAS